MQFFKSFRIGDRVKTWTGKVGTIVRFTNNLEPRNTLIVIHTDTKEELIVTGRFLKIITKGM